MRQAIRPGRYVLDSAGRLHPLRRRYHVQAVAVVTVRPFEPCERPSAGSGSVAPEGERALRDGPSPCSVPPQGERGWEPEEPGAVRRRIDGFLAKKAAAARKARRVGKSVHSKQAEPPLPPPAKIDLANAPSSMEQAAASWKGKT